MQSSKCVRKFTHLSSILVISASFIGQAVVAAPFCYQYNDTISETGVSGLSVDQSAQITVTLDNGGTSRNSQTWNSTHLTKVKFDFNNGAVVTTFSTPFDGNLDSTDGSFESDVSGALTSVMSDWYDENVTNDVTKNTTGVTPYYWYLNGENGIYYENSSDKVELANVSNMTTASNWVTSACVAPPPVSASVESDIAFALTLVGVMLIAAFKLRKARKT